MEDVQRLAHLGGVNLNVGLQAIGNSKNIDYLNIKKNYIDFCKEIVYNKYKLGVMRRNATAIR